MIYRFVDIVDIFTKTWRCCWNIVDISLKHWGYIIVDMSSSVLDVINPPLPGFSTFFNFQHFWIFCAYLKSKTFIFTIEFEKEKKNHKKHYILSLQPFNLNILNWYEFCFFRGHMLAIHYHTTTLEEQNQG